MNRYSPIAFAVIGLILLLVLASVIPTGTAWLADKTAGVETESYEEETPLFDGRASIEIESTSTKRFLSGIFGETIENRVYITDVSGTTDKVSIYDITFEEGSEWKVRREGERRYKKDGTELSDQINHYTIIGEKAELTRLIAEFTKTFDMEFNKN